MGHQPCPVPTAVLSSQSEFAHAYCKDLTEVMPQYLQAWQQSGERFDAIATGYFAGGKQIDYALQFIDAFGGNCFVAVDPVMGDNGEWYPAYDRAACRKMKALARRADVLLPNLTELCMLTDADFFELTARCHEKDYFEQIAALAKSVCAKQGVIVTGIAHENDICNLVTDGATTEIIRSHKIGERFSGTGDIFSAVVCGCLLSGKSLTEAAEAAARFTERAIADTVGEPHNPMHGVNFEKNLYTLAEVK